MKTVTNGQAGWGGSHQSEEFGGLFGWWGRTVYRWRWPVVILWLGALLAALPLLPRVPGRLSAGGFSDPLLPAAQAEVTLRQELGLPANTMAVFYRSAGRPYADPEVRAAVNDSLRRVQELAQVVGVVPPDLNSRQIGRSGKMAYALVSLSGAPEATLELLPELERRAAVPDLPDGTRVEATVAGGATFFRDLQSATENDVRRAELVTLPVAAIVLTLVFGSLAAAAVPVVVGAATIVLGLAGIYVLTYAFSMSIFALNLASMLALGLGTDYALFLVSRFREELKWPGGVSGEAGPQAGWPGGTARAVEVAMGTAGRAVFFSAGTVLIGLGGLIAFRFGLLRSLGVAGTVAVAAAVIASLTLLPAILAILGPRVNALPVPLLRHRSAGGAEDAEENGFWGRLAWFVLRHPWRVLIPTLLLLIGLGWPFIGARLSTADARILPPESESRRMSEVLAAEFAAGDAAPLLLVLTAPGPVTEPAQLDVLYDFTRTVAGDPRVARVESIVDLDPRLTREQYALLYANPELSPDLWARGAAQALARGQTTLVSVVPALDPLGDETKALVKALRATEPAPGWRVQVTGATAGALDLTEYLYRDFPLVAGIVILVTYVLLLFTFRSAVLPLKAVVMNILSLFASFGALAVVFQNGALARLPGPFAFAPLGYVEATLPILLFCTLFGLSMDYEVFLLSRVREAYLATGDNARSVAVGLQRSGRVITGAAAIVVAVAGSFAVAAGVVQIKALALGIAIAVLVDATIVRALVVPATMRLLGDWNWWLPARSE
ncbi:MAG TPA: MMPL family transporter, partial [Chloroflexota bacterium]|nr:MMPL family transporter [Chloroflexota bacterium]